MIHISGVNMRCTTLALAMLAAPVVLGAQRRDTTRAKPGFQTVPRDVRDEVVTRWNGTNALRASQRTEVAGGTEVRGDVAVLHGPLIIAGHVSGNVLAINSDVLLRPSAHIDGGLLVVGGDVEGRTNAKIDGSVRIYHQALLVHEENGSLVAAESDSDVQESWWQRLERRHQGNWTEALRIVQAGPYNRVEGLPIELGPVIHQTTSWGSFQINAAAILRTGSFNSSNGDVGHNLQGEFRFGQRTGFGLGARAFSVVEPVERWQLTDLETALAAFLARRDYRDYYQRHGGEAFLTLYGGGSVSLTGSFGEERWSSRTEHNPFTLFDDDRPWRPNPRVDEGLFHVGTATLKLDTRTDPDDPWSGWYMNTNLEYGRGTIVGVAATSDSPRFLPPGAVAYTRALMDFRRYNRVGPEGQLNVRLVLGGRLGGDELPLERRFSVDGPGVLPGFDFRSPRAGTDVGTCNRGLSVPGRPAECDRIMLAQVEYRGHLHTNFTGDSDNWPLHFRNAAGDVAWVIFADAGRGWRVGDPLGDLRYNSQTIPPLSTFRTDVGVGLDLGGFGLYAAKSTSTPSEPVNFFVRIKNRF
ncbi:MAG: BamA/TamA family outer membrane protein [Gemmatimonadaceae bacterium]